MTTVDKNILKRRLLTLKKLKPSTEKEKRLVEKEISKVEKALASNKPMPKQKKEKRPLVAKRIDWEKVKKAAAKR